MWLIILQGKVNIRNHVVMIKLSRNFKHNCTLMRTNSLVLNEPLKNNYLLPIYTLSNTRTNCIKKQICMYNKIGI